MSAQGCTLCPRRCGVERGETEGHGVCGVGTLAGDTQLLKLVHDEARSLLRNRDSADAQAVIRLAQEAYVQKFRDAAIN